MSNLEIIALAETPTPVVKVHPTVVFSILNNFVRRNDREQRVIGALLGIAKEGSIEVSMLGPDFFCFCFYDLLLTCIFVYDLIDYGMLRGSSRGEVGRVLCRN